MFISAKKASRDHAQSLVEAVVGLIILVVIVLAILDISVLIMAGTISDNLAKQAARAAANTTDSASANKAVQDAQKQFPASGTYKSATLTLVGFNPQKPTTNYNYMGSVTVQAKVTVQLPVPIPLLNVGPTIDISANQTEPIVAVPPP